MSFALALAAVMVTISPMAYPSSVDWEISAETRSLSLAPVADSFVQLLPLELSAVNYGGVSYVKISSLQV